MKYVIIMHRCVCVYIIRACTCTDTVGCAGKTRRAYSTTPGSCPCKDNYCLLWLIVQFAGLYARQDFPSGVDRWAMRIFQLGGVSEVREDAPPLPTHTRNRPFRLSSAVHLYIISLRFAKGERERGGQELKRATKG